MTGLVDEGRTVVVIGLDFSKAFDIVSCYILIDRQMKYRLDKRTLRQIENLLNWWAERVVISVTKSSWRPDTTGVNQESTLGSYTL